MTTSAVGPNRIKRSQKGDVCFKVYVVLLKPATYTKKRKQTYKTTNDFLASHMIKRTLKIIVLKVVHKVSLCFFIKCLYVCKFRNTF